MCFRTLEAHVNGEETTSAHTLSRRALLGASLGALGLGLSGCGWTTRAAEVRLYQSKPEAIPYFRKLVARFNDSQDGALKAVHDTASNLSSGFARAAPPDLGLLNYNYEMARFQERGELSDLSDIASEARIAPRFQDLVDQYPTYPGRTSAIPYSVTSAATLYNKEIFDKHGLDIPRTHSEFLDVCDTLQEAGETPICLTSAAAWTIAQGIVDYSIGGSIDVAHFFERLRNQGDQVTPESEFSFSQVFREPLKKALTITSKYANKNADGLKYGDGNVAFARGKAAMYFQGPWALPDILKLNPEANLGVFPLPMTENAEDLKVRINLDLALWIPEKAKNPEAARKLLRYLITPEVADDYNEKNLGYSVRDGAPAATDPRLVDMQSYVDRAAFYQGVSTAVPKTIPFESYMQGLFTGDDLDETLRTLDGDWQRLARRQTP